MSNKICVKCLLFFLLLALSGIFCRANNFSDNTFLIANISPSDYKNSDLWNFIADNNWVALELNIGLNQKEAVLGNSNIPLSEVLEKIAALADSKDSKIIPVFINYSGDIHLLDSIITVSPISRRIFYLPQGETWPSTEYMVQANRRIIFFVDGEIENESRIFHPINDYSLQISASRFTPSSVILDNESKINKELFKINDFQNLPTGSVSSRLGKNMVPDYVNFLLENWRKFGKKPNFIGVGNNIVSFDFIVDQLNSFNSINGQVRTTGKNLERVYWKNPDILMTGGKFSFPIRGGEEIILSPFVPGYRMTPAQLIITAEMTMQDDYPVLATPMSLSEGLTASFQFEGSIVDLVNPTRNYTGENYSFTEDIDRGVVLKLPENANVLLGNPERFGLPNSSFTVSCFVKFTDILEFGDNAILGNNETGYRRGMHLILRSGHPYFGLWSNDYISEEVLENNIWYHLTWRYIIETGQQAIFLNGKFVGGSDGHPPYSGTSDLHIGSAFSQGASLRGYIDNLNFWDRPLGIEEINRLSIDEEIILTHETDKELPVPRGLLIAAIVVVIMLIAVLLFLLVFRLIRTNKKTALQTTHLPPAKNQIKLFGEFKAINAQGEDISSQFTPKVRELLVFSILHTMKNNNLGAAVSEVDATLWEGISPRKVANNRAVTLNKLRKNLVQFNQVDLISHNGYLIFKTKASFFCDYVQAFQLCQIREGMSREQLEAFFHIVREGSLLKGAEWSWLDEIRGYIGNQVIDNLLKLASYYQKEKKPQNVEEVAQRILDYDDLNEEAVYLQVWAQQKTGNLHLAKFHFESFCNRYEKNMGTKYEMSFNEFSRHFAENG